MNQLSSRDLFRHQLQEYPLLLKENKRLTEVNKLLIETGENTKLLKSQNEDLQSRLSHAEAKCLNSQETEHALNSAQSQLRKWQLLCRQLVSSGMAFNALFSKLFSEPMVKSKRD